jgi:hypothetical protein
VMNARWLAEAAPVSEFAAGGSGLNSSIIQLSPD